MATYIQIVTWTLHVGWCYLFIVTWQMGVHGAAMALNITYILNFTIQELYVKVVRKEVFKEFSAPLFEEESFLDWGMFIKLAVPTTFLMCIEWWAFEFIVIFAGILGVKELAAQIAIMMINGIVFMVPLGLQYSASGLVGNALGKGNPAQAKRLALMCVIVCVTIVSGLSVSLNVWREAIASIFTKDPETIELVASILPALSAFVLLDALHGVQAGNVRALGKQGIVSLCTLLCYYGVGLPLAIYLGFSVGLGVNGFWYGYIIAMAIVDVITLFVVIKSSWVANFVLKPKSATSRG